jgi:hypothetical protein
MATGSEVLSMLIPNGGWVTRGDEFEEIEFLECEPITKKEFTDGFKTYETWKTKIEADKAKARSDLLAKLGITPDEAVLLLA